MNVDVVFFFSASAIMFCIFLGFLIWGFKTEQFKDVETVKFKVLEEQSKEEKVLEGDDK